MHRDDNREYRVYFGLANVIALFDMLHPKYARARHMRAHAAAQGFLYPNFLKIYTFSRLAELFIQLLRAIQQLTYIGRLKIMSTVDSYICKSLFSRCRILADARKECIAVILD